MNLYSSNLVHERNNSNINGKTRKQRDAELRINAEIRTVLTELEDNDERRVAFQSLLACVQAHTRLLKPTVGQGSAGWVAPAFLIRRLRSLAARQAHWLRPCHTWRPLHGNLRPVFRSLAQHLLTRYPVPAFMDSVWDIALGPEGFRQQAWYIRLGRGVPLRELDLPLLLTRKMEHYVRHAPHHFCVNQALRYGEVLAMGGSEKLARQVVCGKLGRRFDHADFWRTVIMFFITHPELQIEHVNPIIDFIDYMKFAGEEVLSDHGAINRPAPWPDFSIKGRTVRSLFLLVNAWHRNLARTAPRQSFSWHKSGIDGYRFVEIRPDDGDDLDWTVHELLDSAALHAEGQLMHHCVFAYAHRCRGKETTIWSLRVRVKDHEKGMATIEVDPRRRSIIQVRARSNHCPGVRSRQVIAQWAASAGLSVECEL